MTPGQTGVTPTGRDLAVDDGGVTLDASADVRASLSAELAEPWPTRASTDQVTPYGTEVFVTRGVVLGNGKVVRAPLGYFRLTDVDQDDAPAGPLQITGQDRMSRVVEARLEQPQEFASAATYGAVVASLVGGALPGVTIQWDDTAVRDTAVGRKLIAEEDRYAFLADVVKALGKVVYFDYRGICVVRTPPSIAAPVVDIAAGKNGVLVKIRRSLTRADVFNAVVATGEAADDTPPVRAVARDEDPTSPTYYYGDFGRVPRFYSSPVLKTTAQALSAAKSILAQELGLPYSVDFQAVPNPALEPLDAVRVIYPPVPGRVPSVATEVHVLDQLGISLGPGGAMSAKTRLTTTAGVFTA